MWDFKNKVCILLKTKSLRTPDKRPVEERGVASTLHIGNKRVSDCCLTPTQQFFSYIMARTKLIFTEMILGSALY